MNSHFKIFEKETTGKIGVWGIKIKNMKAEIEIKTKPGMQLTVVKNL